MSNRENLPEWIARYNENDLSEGELRTFLEMLNKNPDLKKEVNLDKELNADLEDADMLEFRRRLIQSRPSGLKTIYGNRKLLLLAACLLTLLTLEVIINHLCSRPVAAQKDKEASAETYGNKKVFPWVKPATKNPETFRIAMNFRPNPVLEGLVGSKTRSEYFILTFPMGEHCFTMKDNIYFTWKSAPDKPVQFILVDNRGTVVFESGRVAGNFLSVDKSRMHPGLFYFKVLRNGDMIWFGRFSLNR